MVIIIHHLPFSFCLSVAGLLQTPGSWPLAQVAHDCEGQILLEKGGGEDQEGWRCLHFGGVENKVRGNAGHDCGAATTLSLS